MTSTDTTFDSLIGKGAKVSGKLNFRAPAQIEGEIDGEVTGDELVIARGAIVTARISCNRLTIAGQVSGEIRAVERLELLPGASLRGSVTTPRMVLNEGARFDGDCRMPQERVAALA